MPTSQAPRFAPKLTKTSFNEPLEARQTRRVNVFVGAILAFFSCALLGYLGVLDLIPPLRHFPFGGLIFAVLGAWIGARRVKWVLGFAGATALLLFVVAYSPITSYMVRAVRMEASPQEIARGADVVMVLGSWVQSNGEFTGPAMSRLLRGLELVRQKRAPLLVLSEIEPPAGSYIKAARRMTENLNAPVRLEALPGSIHNTRDEAVRFAALAKQRGWKRAFVVTSPTHTRRVALSFRRAAQGQNLQILPVAGQEFDANLEQLNDPGERINAFNMALREIVGIWVYKRRGWI